MRSRFFEPIKRLPAIAWLSLIPIAIFLYLIVKHRFGLVDDAYIPMVYARNVLEGHGIVFYPGGERVEGFTSPLWMGLLTLFSLIPASVPLMAFCSSIFFGMAAITASMALYKSAFASRGEPKWFTLFWALCVGLFLAMDFSLPGWSASGLETSAYTFLQVLFLFALYNKARECYLAVLLLLLALLRPEGGLFVIPLAIAVILQKRPIVSFLKPFTLYFLVPLVLFFAFRLGYFGVPLPNSFYAKHNFEGWFLLQRGLVYVYSFFVPRPLLFFALIWLLLEKNKRNSGEWLFPTFILLNSLIVILEGGDHFPLHRFLVPVLPFLMILTVRGMHLCLNHFLARRFWPAQPATAGLIGFALLLVLLAQHHSQFLYTNKDSYQFTKGVRWMITEVDWARGWKKVGLWLKSKYPPGTKIAVITAGAIPYYSELPALDIVGINQREVALTPLKNPTGDFPGHEKSNADVILAEKPIYIQLFPLLLFSRHPYPEKWLERMLTYPAQKDIWRHPSFQRFYRYNKELTEHGWIMYFERIGNHDK